MRIWFIAFCSVASALLVGCGRTELWLDIPLEANAGAHSSGTGGASEAGASSNDQGGAAGDGAPTTCADTGCGAHELCDPKTLTCDCLPGFVRGTASAACVAIACEFDADCDDGNPCDGEETCDSANNRCRAGNSVVCPAHEQCTTKDGSPSCACADGYFANNRGACLPACDVPLAPVISVIDRAEILHFSVAGSLPIETAIQPASTAVSSAAYLSLGDVSLAAHSGLTRVLARVNDPSCVPVTVFDAVYDIRDTCAPSEQEPTTTAIAKNDPLITGWAAGIQDYRVGTGVTQLAFTDPHAALGPAQGVTTAVVSLGDGGELSLSFAEPITNGPSWDLAVFENAFNDSYLELGFVEVSSDGEHFLRFDSAFLGAGPAATAYAGDARNICGIAGNYAVGFGTPFDLDALQNQPLARRKVVDLNAIRYVRIVDIVGDGSTLDSFGRPILDAGPSTPTAGFDLDAIAALHGGAE